MKEQERGSALLTVVIAVAVLALIAGVFFSLSASRARMETSEEKGLRAYYMAEAGIQFAVAHAYNLMGIPTDPVTEHDPFDTGENCSFTVEWMEDEEEGTVTVRSVGEYQGVVRRLEAKFPLNP